MTQQYHRNIRATIGLGDGSGVEVTELRMAFEVRRSLLGNDIPNVADLRIYNLSRESRELMSNAPHKDLRIEVGYGTDSPVLHQIFYGQATSPIVHTHEDSEWISRILANDTYLARQNATISQSFAAGTPFRTLLKAVAVTFGLEDVTVPEGDLDDIPVLLRGQVLSGKSIEVLERLTLSHGLDWSFQDGVLEVSGYNSFYGGSEIPHISPSTGMINSPVVTDEGVEVRMLMNPLVKVKRPITIESAAADIRVDQQVFRQPGKTPKLREGAYSVSEVVHSGDTYGNDWTTFAKTFPFGAAFNSVAS